MQNENQLEHLLTHKQQARDTHARARCASYSGGKCVAEVQVNAVNDNIHTHTHTQLLTKAELKSFSSVSAGTANGGGKHKR